MRLAALAVLSALVHLQEMVVEEQDPHVPVGDQRKRGTITAGMRARAQQTLVVGFQVILLKTSDPSSMPPIST